MKRSELKQIIMEVIEESKLHEEAKAVGPFKVNVVHTAKTSGGYDRSATTTYRYFSENDLKNIEQISKEIDDVSISKKRGGSGYETIEVYVTNPLSAKAIGAEIYKKFKDRDFNNKLDEKALVRIYDANGDIVWVSKNSSFDKATVTWPSTPK